MVSSIDHASIIGREGTSATLGVPYSLRIGMTTASEFLLGCLYAASACMSVLGLKKSAR